MGDREREEGLELLLQVDFQGVTKETPCDEEKTSAPESKNQEEEEEEVVDPQPNDSSTKPMIKVLPNYLNHSSSPSFAHFVGEKSNPKKRKPGTNKKWLDIDFVMPLMKRRKWTHQLEYRAHAGNSVCGIANHTCLQEELVMENYVSPRGVSNKYPRVVMLMKKQCWRRVVNYRAFIGNVVRKCALRPP